MKTENISFLTNRWDKQVQLVSRLVWVDYIDLTGILNLVAGHKMTLSSQFPVADHETRVTN